MAEEVLDYYAREAEPVGDGTLSFATLQDERNEADAARLLEAHWKCELHLFGKLSPIDWYATRHGRIVAVAELKTRTHPSGRFPTVFLNVRKWLALSLAETGLGVPALFAVSFTDGVFYVRNAEVDASQVRIGGCSRVVKSSSDVEPVIEVPLELMRRVA
jgi:hypothetical protein